MFIRRQATQFQVQHNLNFLYSDASKSILTKYFFLNIVEHSVMKDNPAFSMVNDSDEDVVYGSDDDGRKPLTINLTSKDDDSDQNLTFEAFEVLI